MTGSWRCPLCGGFMVEGTKCVWTAKGSLFRPCPGERPAKRLPNVRSLGRGIGNKPPGYRSDK